MADDALPAEPTRGRSVIAGRGLFAGAAHRVDERLVTLPGDVRTVDDLGGLNHSCDPNLGWADARTLAALRAIGPGEELTVDYSTAIDDPTFVLYCHCGSTRCRQAVEGTDWQIPQLQARYAGRWAPRIRAKLDDAH